MAATGNASFGYYAGGTDNNLNKISSVDRIDYFSDTATALVKVN